MYKINSLKIKDGTKLIRYIKFNETLNSVVGKIKEENDLTSNSLGKSTLIKLISYIFGAKDTKNSIITSKLRGLYLEVDTIIEGKNVVISRVIGDNKIFVDHVEYKIDKFKKDFNIIRNYLEVTYQSNTRETYLKLSNEKDCTAISRYLTLLNMDKYVENIQKYYDKKNKQEQLIKTRNLLKKRTVDRSEENRLKNRKKELENKLELINEGNIEEIRISRDFKYDEYQSLTSQRDVLLSRVAEVKQEISENKSAIKNLKETNNYNVDNIYEVLNQELGNFLKKNHEDVAKFNNKYFNERIIRLEEEVSHLTEKKKELTIKLENVTDKIIPLEQTIGENDKIISLFKEYKDINTEVEEINNLLIDTTQLEKLNVEIDQLKEKILEVEMSIKSEKEQMETDFSKYSEYSYNFVQKLYSTKETSLYLDMKFNDKVNTPVKIEFDIDKDGGEGLGNVKKLIFDLMVLKYSNTVQSMFWDSSCFNGVDVAQIDIIVKEIEEIIKENSKQAVITYNYYQFSESPELLKFLEESQILALSENDTLLNFDF